MCAVQLKSQVANVYSSTEETGSCCMQFNCRDRWLMCAVQLKRRVANVCSSIEETSS
jgi:hypothetical protein